jgi:putative transposase
MIKTPAISTVHAVLDRHGLVQRRKRRRYKARGTELHGAAQANDLWCADYKGEFKLGNRQYCYPLTISDYSARYLLACEGLTCTEFAFAVFERVFKEFGLPRAIRTDNGVPFASPHALFGLSKLGTIRNFVCEVIMMRMKGTSLWLSRKKYWTSYWLVAIPRICLPRTAWSTS